MDYEIAKQLKYAGFPQNQSQSAIYITEDIPARFRKFISVTELIEHAAYVPTLEKLIEACGEKFLRLSLKANGRTWIAESRDYDNGEGSTPTEAVARLWLALNKKTI